MKKKKKEKAKRGEEETVRISVRRMAEIEAEIAALAATRDRLLLRVGTLNWQLATVRQVVSAQFEQMPAADL